MSTALPISSDKAGAPLGWGIVALGVIAIGLLFRADWAAMIGVWVRSETFTHGFLVLPISLWLIWRMRARVHRIAPAPNALGWLALGLAAAGWIVGELASVAALKQFAVVAMIPALMLSILGWPLVHALLFPLAFLFFMVPFGEFLMPAMMDQTADFTVWALRISGIPVYREGLRFQIPSGSWSVVEACSGLRYLIAALVLGTLFAYMNYRSLGRRVVFVLIAAVVPIVANWLRAYGIVMLGHLSSMELATGVDHLVYGWLFFGAVMLALFWFGMRWREDRPETQVEPQRTGHDVGKPASKGPWVTSALACAAITLGAASIPARLIDRVVPREVQAPLQAALAAWPSKAAGQHFVPRFSGERSSLRRLLEVDGDQVQVDLFYYARQTDEAEMINQNNVVVPHDHNIWMIAAVQRSATPAVIEYQLNSKAGRLLAWQWFAIDGATVTAPSSAKLMTALALLRGHGDHSIAAVISSPIGDDIGQARARLSSVYQSLEPSARRLTSAGLK